MIEVERPEYETAIDEELTKLQQRDYTDTDLRDIRYRLNVLDHKLDTLLSQQGDREDRLQAIADRQKLILENMLDLTQSHVDILVLCRNFTRGIERDIRELSSDTNNSWNDVDWSIEQLHKDMRRAITELTNVPWHEVDESNEPRYEQVELDDDVIDAILDNMERDN